MEFFAALNSQATEQNLQQQLRIDNLADFCASIYEIVKDEEYQGEISMVWGLFEVRRECIRGGVRFTLPNCLNGVAWTITISLDEANDEVMVHCTINRKEQDADFVESLEDFVNDWREGLDKYLQLGKNMDKTQRTQHA